MESTGVYHKPIERFLLENNFKVFVINSFHGKMHKRNLRKTKTDKEDCFNLVNIKKTLILLNIKFKNISFYLFFLIHR